MKIAMYLNKTVMAIAITLGMFFGMALDSEGWWAPRGLACCLCVIMITAVINVYLKEVQENEKIY